MPLGRSEFHPDAICLALPETSFAVEVVPKASSASSLDLWYSSIALTCFDRELCGTYDQRLLLSFLVLGQLGPQVWQS